MLVSLWNRDVTVSDDQVARLRAAIDKIVSARGEDSVSYLIDAVRQDTGIKFPTRMVDAETMFEALGYKLRKEYGPHHSVRRTYVCRRV